MSEPIKRDIRPGTSETEVGTQEREYGTEIVASFLLARQETAFSSLPNCLL